MKSIVISIIIAVVLIGGAIYFSQGKDSVIPNYESNVSVVDGKQIIEISAKGGYQPRRSVAKAGIPTILRMNTKGTFDCSLFMRIPSMGISQSLPQSGVTDIDLGIQQVSVLKGTCGMGMYPFEIEFVE